MKTQITTQAANPAHTSLGRMARLFGAATLSLTLLFGAAPAVYADSDSSDKQMSKEQQLKQKLETLRKQYEELQRNKRRKTERRSAPPRKTRQQPPQSRQRRYRDDRNDNRRYRDNRRDKRRYQDNRRNERRYRDDRNENRRRYRDDRNDNRRNERPRYKSLRDKRNYERRDVRRHDRRRDDRRRDNRRLGYSGRRDHREMRMEKKVPMFRPSTRRFVLDVGVGGSMGFISSPALLVTGSLLFGAHLGKEGKGLGLGGSIDLFKNTGSSKVLVQTLFHGWWSLHIKGGFYIAPYVALGFTWLERSAGSFDGLFETQLGVDLKFVFNNRFYLKVRPVSLDIIFDSSSPLVRYAGSAAFGVTF
ncbi:MAG: hypothetical protein CL920_13040 [Deltaproteobacteria bacterium]|nr:hypothetical protein [Deltaproteobacteria bacterium]MBU49614.1 hypothetical protein [Deltaproteobacteria bacterium]|tara:strand:- start:17151 stop:18233 length:1083 start_codon:yes stop_codon:yes gene_type:complete